MDLWKALDTLDHSLSLEKLSASGFENNSLSLVQSYLTNRFQRYKTQNDFSSWPELTTSIPQGSILGPLPFNSFISDIFLFVESSNVCNYSDDITLFAFAKN